MNNLLKVKLTFNHEPNRAGGGARNLNKTRETTSTTIESLISDLNRIKAFYNKNPYIKEILISHQQCNHYNRQLSSAILESFRI